MDDQQPLSQPPVMGLGIQPININDEMKNSYLEYAMSVIVGRALPDVRDGLKPVHRRILYSMFDSGFTSSRPYKKCARIVGDVLGRYHPHGDSAIYDALVRMAQDFSLRYPLIDGQGNYGSIDGDNAAAMRYTEARMSKVSMEFLADIEKDTVRFVPNFDESLDEPEVLPTRVPNLLLNGTSGIAVGMATNIPPHNLHELIDGIVAYIENQDIDVAGLMQHIQAPDFPTAGLICGTAGITQAYQTGRGIFTIRSKTHVEESKKKGKKAIIVTEIPYMVNKSNVIVKIAELVQEKKLTGIADLRDESDRKGLRIYIELKRDAHESVVLNQLFKHTQLQTSFGINMVALVNSIPRTLNLKEVIAHYVAHRKDVVKKRTEFDLAKAQARLHILEGLRIALQHIDAIIALIKQSPDTDRARTGLMDVYALSEKQANAILEMRLQRLTGLERDKIESEYQSIVDRIKDLEDILAREARIYEMIKAESLDIKERFGDARRTEITGEVSNVNIEDLVPNIRVAIIRTSKGFIKRVPIEAFKSQLRGGRGVNSMNTRDEDMITDLMVASTHDYLLCFSTTGRTFKIKAYQIQEASRQSKGVSLAHLLSFEDGEQLTAIIPVSSFDTDEYLVMATKKGIIKKTPLRAFIHFKNKPIISINLDEDDTLNWVKRTNGSRHVIMVTSAGMVIRFDEDQVRPMGRVSRGIKGIRIKDHDELVTMDVVDPDENKRLLFLITQSGFGKNIRIKEFKVQNRAGLGVMSIRFRKSIQGDRIVDAAITSKQDDIMIVTKSGTMCRQQIANISTQRRESQGVKIVMLDKADHVISIAKVMTAQPEAS